MAVFKMVKDSETKYRVQRDGYDFCTVTNPNDGLAIVALFNNPGAIVREIVHSTLVDYMEQRESGRRSS